MAAAEENKDQTGLAGGLRIALFTGNYNYIRDGQNKALNRLVAFLLEEGAAVRVYSPVARRPAFEPAGDLVPVPSFRIPGRSEYRIAPRLTRRVKADIRRFRPTHFHLSTPDWLGTGAQAFAAKLGAPVVTSLHTRFETYLQYYKLGFLAGWMRRRLDRFYGTSDFILVPTDAIAEDFRAKGWGEKLGIWSRGVEHDIFHPGRRDPEWRRAQGYPDEDVILLFFGRLVVEKGLDVFADAVAELRRRGRDLRPMIVGDGPAASWLKQRLPDAAYIGHIEDAELARAVASADILINPSVTEAFGNVNLEAMASGLAVVSANVGSASSLIVDGKSGLLVPPKEPAAYAEAVERLLLDPALRRRLAAAAHAASRSYVWREVLKSVLDAYRRVERR